MTVRAWGVLQSELIRAAHTWLLYGMYVRKEEGLGFSALTVIKPRAFEGTLLTQSWQRQRLGESLRGLIGIYCAILTTL